MIYTKEKIDQLKHRWTSAKGKKLIKTIKESRCYLSPVLFREKVKNFSGINDEEVKNGIDLRGIPLTGYDFRVKIQEQDDGYIENIAILSEIHFEGASLKHCTFEDGKIHNCYFEHADLSYVNLKNSSISTCNFQESTLAGANLQETKITNCSFIDANIRDISISTSTFLDEKTNFGKELKTEKEGNLHFASIEYKQIKQMYKNSSLYNIADHYHYKENIAKRKTKPKHSPARILNYMFGDLLCKYGTSFGRVLTASMVIILFTTLLYMPNDALKYNGSILHYTSFSNALYFSIVTFTTLGYGDFHATGYARFVAGMESFMGAALIALFTVIVARKLIRD